MEKTIISVIVNYNDIANTIACVDSLLSQSLKTKIVVWDNNSSDNSAQILAEKYGSNIHILYSDKNVYWTPAINKSLEIFYNNEDYIHYTNNDIVYPNQSLERMIEDIESTDAGMVGPTGSALGGLQDYVSHQLQKDGEFNSFDEFYAFIKGKTPTRASSIQGACVVMPRKAWIKVGSLDENMPLGADDFDISLRMKEVGYALYVSEQAYVHHKGHASGQKAPGEWNAMGKISWDYFNNKWSGYFHNEMEALRCIWEHRYYPNWDIGTGWMSEEVRIKVWEDRGLTYDGSPIHNSLPQGS